jgi:hypothetical protein
VTQTQQTGKATIAGAALSGDIRATYFCKRQALPAVEQLLPTGNYFWVGTHVAADGQNVLVFGAIPMDALTPQIRQKLDSQPATLIPAVEGGHPSG